MPDRLVVVGGDAGGMTAAATARRRSSVDELEIVAFERGDFTSYSACGIPYYVSDVVTDVDALIARTPEEHRANGIDVRTGHEVTAIDLDARTVEVHGPGGTTTEPFDRLVVATGANPIRPPIPGIDADGVLGVQTLGDGTRVRTAVDSALARGATRAVIIGAGYIGLELAESLVRRGFDVALVEQAEQPMRKLDPDMGALVADALRDVGIELHLGITADAIETADGAARAVVTREGSFPADLVILGIGVEPNSALAAEAGIRVGEETHGIVTDDHMRTSADGVWAAGDCVEVYHRLSRQQVVVALGTHANKQGRVVGINVTGGDAEFPGVIGTAVAKICRYEVARTGLSEQEAADAGFDAVAATIESTTRASYYPDASAIHVKVVAERGTGRLLGAQIVGEEGAGKRIDVFATAIWNEMTAADLGSVDLSYAPPVAPVWDPVIVAARQAAAAARG